MELAIAEARASDAPVLAKIARKHGISRPALSRRFHGLSTSMAHREENKQALSNHQEKMIIDQIKQLSDLCVPPPPAFITSLASSMAGRPLSKNWASRFIQRHKDILDSRYLQNVDLARHQADSLTSYESFFDGLAAVIEKHDITAENMYNVDEKGFMIGASQKARRVFAKQKSEFNEPPRAGQDGDQEGFTILATICADGTTLSPAVIYKADTGDAQNVWIENCKTNQHNCYFASSPDGWTSDELAMHWLVDIFDKESRRKSKRSWRLLFLDGHGSHLNTKFISKCTELKIYLAFYPPHSTHRLQPLDNGCFSSLADHYSQGLDQMVTDSGGQCSIEKRDFLPNFWLAYQKTFVKKTIESAWEKTGIWPFNPEIALGPLRKRPATPLPAQAQQHNDGPRPPTGVCTVSRPAKLRRFLAQTSVNADPKTRKSLQFLAHRLSEAQRLHDSVKLENAQLKFAAMQNQPKKKRQLKIGEQTRSDERTGALSVDPVEVQQARDIQAKDAQGGDVLVEQRAAEKTCRAQQKRQARAAAKSATEAAAAAKKADSLASRAVKQAQKRPKQAYKSAVVGQEEKSRSKLIETAGAMVQGKLVSAEPGNVTVTRSGRLSTRPAHKRP